MRVVEEQAKGGEVLGGSSQDEKLEHKIPAAIDKSGCEIDL